MIVANKLSEERSMLVQNNGRLIGFLRPFRMFKMLSMQQERREWIVQVPYVLMPALLLLFLIIFHHFLLYIANVT